VIQVGTGDFSLVRVNSYNQNPIQLGLNTGPIVAGSSFVSAGYGGYGQQGQSPWNYSQKLHGMTSRISGTQVDTWAGYSGTTIIDTFDSPTSSNFTTIEGFGAPGDSGSAVINSNNEIMGVLSYGDFETYGGRNYYWALTQSNVASIYQTTGITPVPEPLTLAGLGLVALVAARRRKKG
jgi:V8-like Glu-specific endopeptidase